MVIVWACVLVCGLLEFITVSYLCGRSGCPAKNPGRPFLFIAGWSNSSAYSQSIDPHPPGDSGTASRFCKRAVRHHERVSPLKTFRSFREVQPLVIDRAERLDLELTCDSGYWSSSWHSPLVDV
jgi:hypothetical protein